MADYPALPLWTDAYIADTGHLTNEEHGVYLRLLMAAWRAPSCSLPDDDRRLALMVGVTPKKWASLRPIISAFWTVADGRWTQKRLTAERNFVEGKSKRGKDAAEARWQANQLENKKTGNANAYAKPMLEACEADAPIPIPTPTPTVDSGGFHPPESTQEEEGARDARGLVVRVMEALGIDLAKPPRRWRSPTGPTHVCAWPLTLGLTEDEVVEACRASRLDNPDPPDSPAALDGYLRSVAKTKTGQAAKPASRPTPPAAPKMTHDEAQAKALTTWAERLRAAQYVPPSALKPAQARALLADPAFGVTPDMLRRAGISH